MKNPTSAFLANCNYQLLSFLFKFYFHNLFKKILNNFYHDMQEGSERLVSKVYHISCFSKNMPTFVKKKKVKFKQREAERKSEEGGERERERKKLIHAFKQL